MQTIIHGQAVHNYFGIIRPAFTRGGLDCSSVAMGIGVPHKLKDPRTGESVLATLVLKRTLYVDSDLFLAIILLVYGATKEEVLGRLRALHEDMVEDYVELWIFRKE